MCAARTGGELSRDHQMARFYRRMGIEVTPEMTLVKKELAVESPKQP